MKKILISPLYVITHEVGELLEDNRDAVVIIVDDLSPVIPLQSRLNWLDTTFLGHDFTVLTIEPHQDSEDIKKYIEMELARVGITDLDEYMLYSDVNLMGMSTIRLEGIADVFNIETRLFDMFQTRHMAEFKELIQFKPHEQKEILNVVVPYFEENGRTYFGLLYSYPERKNVFIESDKDKDYAVNRLTIMAYVKYIMKVDKVEKIDYLGGIGQVDFYLAKINPPSWVDVTKPPMKGLRRLLNTEMDVVWIPDVYFLDAIKPYSGWMLASYKQEKEVNDLPSNG